MRSILVITRNDILDFLFFSPSNPLGLCSLWVGNVSPSVDAGTITEIFSKFVSTLVFSMDIFLDLELINSSPTKNIIQTTSSVAAKHN